MKNFNQVEYATNYASDMAAKLPGYELMFELIFKGILPVEAPKSVTEMLTIGGSVIEAKGLLDQFPSAKLTCLDNSEKMLALIREALPTDIARVHYTQQAFEEHAAQKKYQLVLALLVVHFVHDKQQFFARLFASLADNGCCILSAFSNQHLDWWKEYALANGAKQIDVLRTFHQQEQVMESVSPQEIEALAQAAGFQRMEKFAQILTIDAWILFKQ